MENIRVIILVLASTALLPGAVFAYERDTHMGLTEATVRAYEEERGDVFGELEAKAMIQGSYDEDDDWRFMRHFYDPINNRGLLGQFISSKIWAQDTEGQGNYNCVNSWLCNGKHIGYNDKFFSSPTDFSWDRAIYEYVYGDKVRAAASLGHIVHLLQDATVPAHVRNDPHPSHGGLGDTDPYERFTGQFESGQINVPGNMEIKSFPGIAHAFDDIANFTNKNFVSKDTLFKHFNEPNLNNLSIRDGFAYNETRYKVARARERFNRDSHGGKREFEIHIDDDKNSVVSDYWRVLSKRSIETGVGIIDLFFREVEKEKKTVRLLAMSTSAAERRGKETALN